MNLTVIILAAGEGKRMKSAVPKVLHPVAGRPMLGHMLDTCERLGARRQVVVVGHGRDTVEGWVGDRAETVHQAEQLGTGHAVLMTEHLLGDETSPIMVVSGDTPLITDATLRSVVDAFEQSKAAAAMVTAKMDNPFGYGRVIRRNGGDVARIVEEKDASPDERALTEVNTGIYCFDRERLFAALHQIGNDNQQGEYYLTDVIKVLRDQGETVLAAPAPVDEVMGVNSRGDQAEAERIMQHRLKKRLMEGGATFILPETTYVEVDVEIMRDTVILPHCHLEDGTRIGTGAKIGPGVRARAAHVGDWAEISYAVLNDCRVAQYAKVGPYASIRPGTEIQQGAKAGTFVEIKNSEVGSGSKIPHLSYIGDAHIGSDVNVGAGSITCNYDGAKKHKTVIKDGAFLGSDTMLVAPVTIGEGAATGAGSTISHDVPADSLALERAEQRTFPGWAKQRKAKKD